MLIETSRVLGREAVTILVGAQSEEFVIHKNLLDDKSDFFAHIFQGNGAEASTGRLSLPNDDPRIFSIFLDYLYRGQILDTGKPSTAAARLAHARTMVSTYILAEKLCINDLMNMTIDRLRDTSLQHLTDPKTAMGLVSLIYGNTHSKSELRKLYASHTAWILAKVAVFGSMVEVVATVARDIPDFGADILMAHFSLKSLSSESQTTSPVAAPGQMPKCSFHVHEASKSCSSEESSPAGIKVKLPRVNMIPPPQLFQNNRSSVVPTKRALSPSAVESASASILGEAHDRSPIGMPDSKRGRPTYVKGWNRWR